MQEQISLKHQLDSQQVEQLQKIFKLMRETVGPEMGVKASGGVRSIEDAEAVIKNGATRIGASASIAICEGKVSDSTY